MRKTNEVVICIHSGKSTSRLLSETLAEIYENRRKKKKEIFSADRRE